MTDDVIILQAESVGCPNPAEVASSGFSSCRFDSHCSEEHRCCQDRGNEKAGLLTFDFMKGNISFLKSE